MELRRKVIGIPLQKATPTEKGTLLVRGFFTSDQRDEVGDIITRTATENALPKYRRWGNIRYMHQPKPVGRVTRIGVDDGLAWNEVEIEVIDPQAMFEVERGLLQALSVGILVDMSKVELLQDGGWVINEYQMAEISLVDHPANYDAELETLNLSLDEGLRNKIREHGAAFVLRSLGAAPAPEGEAMDKNLEDQVVEEVVEEAAPETEPVVEKTITTEAVAAAVEMPVAEAAPVVEDAPVVDETPVVFAEADPTADAVAALMNALTPVLDGLVKQMEAFSAKLNAPEPEADVVGEAVEAAKGISGEGDKVAQLEKQVADLNERISLLTTPVDRKGALPIESPATEESESAPEVEEKKLSLKEALSKHFESRAR